MKLELQLKVSRPNLEVYLLPLPAFPIGEAARPAGIEYLTALTSLVQGQFRLERESFVQVNQLHFDQGPRVLAAHGRRWLPTYGLGVWPGKEPPTLWSNSDFEDVEPGKEPRPLMHSLFRLNGPADDRALAIPALFGRGTLVQVLGERMGDPYLKRGRDLLFPRITEPTFQGFTFYIPLYDVADLEAVDLAEVDAWFCGATFYWRESPEDGGVMIASRVPLRAVVEAAGAQQQPDDRAWWTIKP